MLNGSPELLKVRDAAQRLGLGKSVMYELIRTRKIRSVLIPGRIRPIVRVPADAIQEFIARHTKAARC